LKHEDMPASTSGGHMATLTGGFDLQHGASY